MNIARYKLAIVVFFIFYSMSAQEFSPAIKLQYYVGACNFRQVENLLSSNTNFDIYGSGTGTSPLIIAIARYQSFNTASNSTGCEECLLTIKAVMTDSRYQWKKVSTDRTDLMNILFLSDVLRLGPVMESRYYDLLKAALDILDTKPQFNINYNITLEDKTAPTNAVGALAFSGGKETLCLLIKRYPALRFNLDNRNSADHYTPLMIAVNKRNKSMVVSLCNNGADYYLPVTGFGNFPPYELARQSPSDPTMIYDFLDQRRLGKIPVLQGYDNCIEITHSN